MNLPKYAWGAEFTLAIGCPLNCHYCPQEKLIKKYIGKFGKDKLQMSFEDFKTCLSKIMPNAGIVIGGMVEPFVNKDCARMLKYAYEKGFSISIDTTLQGMTEKDFEIIKDINFEHFQLHIPDEEGNANFKITDEYLMLLNKVNTHFNITGYSCHGTVHHLVKDILDKDTFLFDKMMNRAGNLDYDELPVYNHKGFIECNSGSDKITGWNFDVLPNGTVILCCMDYSMDHILGNLVEQDWEEIVAAEEFQKIEEGMFDENISLLCRKCPVAKNRENCANVKLLAPNATRINRILQKFISGEIKLDNVEEKLDAKSVDIVKKLTSNKEVCIFGIGKLFADNYFNSCWADILNARFISDNNYNPDMEKYNIEFIEPDKLADIKDLLIIIYVKNSTEIEKQLLAMGIENYINIYDIYNLFYTITI